MVVIVNVNSQSPVNSQFPVSCKLTLTEDKSIQRHVINAKQKAI